MKSTSSEKRAALAIVIRPHRNRDGTKSAERFDACLEGQEQVLVTSRQPFLDSARELIELGHDPQTILIMRHDGGVESSRAPIGFAAGLTVDEEKNRAPRLKRWRPFSMAAGAAPIGANDNQWDGVAAKPSKAA